MLNRLCILVTGSRRLTTGRDDQVIVDALAPWLHSNKWDHVVIIHGNALGADRIASHYVQEWCRHANVAFTSIGVPYFEHDGEEARNALLVDLTLPFQRTGYDTRGLAFPDATSRGTWKCKRIAEAAGVPVEVHKC